MTDRDRLNAIAANDGPTSNLAAAKAATWAAGEIDRLTAERDALIAMWPTIDQRAVESGGPTVYGPIDGHWYQQTIGGVWPNPNAGARQTHEAAVRAAAGIEKKGSRS